MIKKYEAHDNQFIKGIIYLVTLANLLTFQLYMKRKISHYHK